MMVCPKCGREFDVTMSFCLEDGTPLRGGPVVFDAPTAVLSGRPGDRRSVSANSVAVLPFVNMSADADNEYFCDGLAEELMNALAKIDDLKVAARTAAFSFRGKNAPMAEIGRALNVNSILEGSVRKSGSRVRITVQLINAADGFHLWSERYDRDMQDIFAIQDEITFAVVDALKVKLLGEEKTAVLRRHTENADAYQLYLKGRFFWNKRTASDLKQAVEFYNQAIEKDPNYALAYSGLAETFVLFGSHDVAPAHDSMPLAKAAALRALEIDDSLAEAHTALGSYLTLYEFDLDESEKEFRRAIELKPNYATAHQWFAANLMVAKRFDEALAELRLAEDLDPLSPDIGTDLGATLVFARRYDEAIAQFKRTLIRDPNFSRVHSYLGWAYGSKEMYAEAIAEARTALELNNSFFIKGYLALWLGRSGERDEALKILAELEKAASEGYVRPSTLAVVYIGLGKKEEALNELEKEVSSRSFNAIYLGVLPDVDELRAETRFKAMLKQMNLPE
jgi:adenylate cyclase